MLFAKVKAMHDAKMQFKLPPEEVVKLLQRGAFLPNVRSRPEAALGGARVWSGRARRPERHGSGFQ